MFTVMAIWEKDGLSCWIIYHYVVTDQNLATLEGECFWSWFRRLCLRVVWTLGLVEFEPHVLFILFGHVLLFRWQLFMSSSSYACQFSIFVCSQSWRLAVDSQEIQATWQETGAALEWRVSWCLLIWFQSLSLTRHSTCPKHDMCFITFSLMYSVSLFIPISLHTVNNVVNMNSCYFIWLLISN